MREESDEKIKNEKKFNEKIFLKAGNIFLLDLDGSMKYDRRVFIRHFCPCIGLFYEIILKVRDGVRIGF